jgi:hypothetical protein
LTKVCQKAVKNLSKVCPIICQKFVNGCQKFGKGSSEEDEDENEEEEDWWLLDQVATLSHLVITKVKSILEESSLHF